MRLPFGGNLADVIFRKACARQTPLSVAETHDPTGAEVCVLCPTISACLQGYFILNTHTQLGTRGLYVQEFLSTTIKGFNGNSFYNDSIV